jgi:MarR family transcriptional regulator, transcriptional regulator for hemolysin
VSSAEPGIGALPRETMESLLMGSSRGLRRAYDNRLAGLGLKISEAYLLPHVHDQGPMTQTQLAENLGLGRAATGALVDALERKGLVERSPDPGDRRVWLVATTQAAAAVVEEITTIGSVLRDQAWSGISRAERRQLTDTLRRLQTNLAAIITDQTDLKGTA